jgi:nitrogen fixation/metabolism regulation signal transduction histidine kinase
MLLRTRIFRQLVIFTLIPALIIAAVSYFLLIRAIDQTSRWLTGAAPERTINSLRITESRLQQDAEMILSLVKPDANDADEYGLDWLFMDDSLITEPLFEPEVYESLLLRIRKCAGGMGPLRSVVGNHLVIGYSTDAGNGCLAGGYIFDREYLDGYQSAIAGLSESRDFKNILPAYLMFIGFTGVSVLAIVVVAAYVLSRRLSASITTPLERLAISAGDIAPGKSPKKIALAGTDEVMGLTDALNRMIIDLEENRRRLMAAERVAAWQEFARRMAHELKNPLTPISISLYRIKKRLQEAGGYERHAESIEAIAAELKHLERMAADYSSLAGLPGLGRSLSCLPSSSKTIASRIELSHFRSLSRVTRTACVRLW